MNRLYRWRCFACDKANEARATSCAACGFPARATGTDIERARATRGLDGMPARWSPPAESLKAQRARWSGWRKGFAISGAALLAIGVYAGVDSFSWRGVGLAVLSLMFGAILFLVACVARQDGQESALQ